MQGKINKNGQLEMFRKTKFKRQICIEGDGDVCGDWCPLFGEPGIPNVDGNGKLIKITLSLCKKELIFEKFKDER